MTDVNKSDVLGAEDEGATVQYENCATSLIRIAAA